MAHDSETGRSGTGAVERHTGAVGATSRTPIGAEPVPERARRDAATGGLAPRLIQRERLETRLDEVFSARAGLVVGPSGSGKSTLLRSWASGTECGSVAWILIEPAHRDARVFVRALSDALADVLVDAVELAVHRPGEAVGVLADAIERSGRRVVIVFDDIHVLIGSDSVDVVRALLSHNSDTMRILVAGRETPDIGLERLDRHGTLLTIAASDLRLDHDETARLVRSVAGVEVDDDTVGSIHRQVGGWTSGAVLAGLVVRASDGPPSATALAIDRHRYVYSYFATEVFDALPNDVGEFLLDTCVLRFLEPDPCAHLARRADAVDVLWHLERRNMFTTWVGGDPPRFRYHGLLRSWLRQHLARVDPARMRELDTRAASWFIAHGRTAEAIEHQIAAKDFSGAIDVIIEYGPRALGEGRYETIRSWIGSIPDRLVTANGPLLVLLAEAEHRVGDREAATATRALLRGLVASRADAGALDVMAVTVAVQRGTELCVRGKLDSAGEQARRALAMIEPALGSFAHVGSSFERLLIAMDLSSAADQLMYAGDCAESARWSRWVVDALPADDPYAAAVRSRCLGQLSVCNVIAGRRFAAEELALEAVALCRLHHLDPLDLGYAELALLVAGRSVDRTALHASLERRAAQIDVPAITCLVDLVRAWSYVQDDDLPASARLLSEARHSMSSVDEPGILGGLARRVEAMVDIGCDEVLLSERERTVLALLASGCTRRSAAEQLHLSMNTVKTHARLAYRALGVTTLDQAVERCEALGIVLGPSPSSGSFLRSSHQLV